MTDLMTGLKSVEDLPNVLEQVNRMLTKDAVTSIMSPSMRKSVSNAQANKMKSPLSVTDSVEELIARKEMTKEDDVSRRITLKRSCNNKSAFQKEDSFIVEDSQGSGGIHGVGFQTMQTSEHCGGAVYKGE